MKKISFVAAVLLVGAQAQAGSIANPKLPFRMGEAGSTGSKSAWATCVGGQLVKQIGTKLSVSQVVDITGPTGPKAIQEKMGDIGPGDPNPELGPEVSYTAQTDGAELVLTFVADGAKPNWVFDLMAAMAGAFAGGGMPGMPGMPSMPGAPAGPVAEIKPITAASMSSVVKVQSSAATETFDVTACAAEIQQ